MEELYFGAPRVGTKVKGPHGRMLTVRKDPKTGKLFVQYKSKTTGTMKKKYLTSPKRKAVPKRKVTPKRTKRSLSLKKLQELAKEHGVDIHSHSKIKSNKKPKKVSKSTLLKRLREHGVDLSPFRIMTKQKDVPGDLFESEPESDQDSGDESELESHPDDEPIHPPYHEMVHPGPTDHHDHLDHHTQHPSEDQHGNSHLLTPAQPAPEMFNQNPNQMMDYYAMDFGRMPYYMNFGMPYGMTYGQRHTSSRRPKHTETSVGMITVRGKERHLFKGQKGGHFYMKGNNKVYVDLNRVKKEKKTHKSPKKHHKVKRHHKKK